MANHVEQKSIAIVGGGAGGIFAALAARAMAKRESIPIAVHLFERNSRLGIKILISGGGKCNITHAGPVESVLREGFRRVAERRFLKHAMYRYTNEDVFALLERQGVTCYTRENGRVFPRSGRAEHVLEAFERELESGGVIVHTRSRIESIGYTRNEWQLATGGKTWAAQALILATGGTSYSKTGTTGDGIRYAGELGHSQVPVRAALAPIYLKQPPTQEIIGISFRETELYVTRADSPKILARAQGDILLTHRGLSGPAVLGISNEAVRLMETAPIVIEANLLGISEDRLRDQLIEAQASRPQQQVSRWLEEMLPNSFVPEVIAQANIPRERRWNGLSREERQRLLGSLLRYPFGAVSEIPLERGEVTSGGVALDEVDPKTMMSRIRSGLFFAGEMLDVAGEIGGYNLQAAYSTGWVAGEESVKFLSTIAPFGA